MSEIIVDESCVNLFTYYRDNIYKCDEEKRSSLLLDYLNRNNISIPLARNMTEYLIDSYNLGFIRYPIDVYQGISAGVLFGVIIGYYKADMMNLSDFRLVILGLVVLITILSILSFLKYKKRKIVYDIKLSLGRIEINSMVTANKNK